MENIDKTLLAELKQKAIEYIRRRVNDSGPSKFYALEILQEVIPDAEYDYDDFSAKYEHDEISCILKWKGLECRGTARDETMATRCAAALALEKLFDISIPLAIYPFLQTLKDKYSKFVLYEKQDDQDNPWKASLTFGDETFEMTGKSKTSVQNDLFQKHRKSIYIIDSRPLRDSCRQTLISYAISIDDHLNQRVEFVMKHLITIKNNNEKLLKPTEGVLTPQERDVVEKFCQNVKIYELQSEDKKFFAFIQLNDQDFVKCDTSELQVKTQLCIDILENRSMYDDEHILSVNDENVRSHIYNSTELAAMNDEMDLNMIREKAVNHAKLCLQEKHLITYPSTFVSTIINYVCFTKQVSTVEIECTIVWKNYHFSSIASTYKMALDDACSQAANILFGLPFAYYHVPDTANFYYNLRNQVKFTTTASRTNEGSLEIIFEASTVIDGKKFISTASDRKSAMEQIINDVFAYTKANGEKEIQRENKKVLVQTLINKNRPSLDRIQFVLEYMRVDTELGPGFESTEDVLNEDERKLLDLIDKTVKIESLDEDYKATFEFEDKKVVREGQNLTEVKNETCLAAYELLFNATLFEEMSREIYNNLGGISGCTTLTRFIKNGSEVGNISETKNIVAKYEGFESTRESSKEVDVKLYKELIIDFIKNYIKSNGLDGLDPLKIVTSVLPDAKLTYETIEVNSHKRFESVLEWNGLQFYATSHTKSSPAKIASAMLLEKLFDISIPVHDKSDYRIMYRRAMQNMVFQQVDGQVKASIYIDGETLEGLGPTRKEAKDEIIKKAIGGYYTMEREEMNQKIYKTLISFVLTEKDPFEDRVAFLCDTFLSKVRDRKKNEIAINRCFAQTSGIFSEAEKSLLMNIYNHIHVEDTLNTPFKGQLTINGVYLIDFGPSAEKIKSNLLLSAVKSLPKHPKCLEIDIQFDKSEKACHDDSNKEENTMNETTDDDWCAAETASTLIASNDNPSSQVQTSGFLQLLKNKASEIIKEETSDVSPYISFPSNFWHQLVGDFVPIQTRALQSNNDYLSSIDFNGKIFKEIGAHRMESRDKVAAVVLNDVFEICLENWQSYLLKRTPEPVILRSKEDRKKTLETELKLFRMNAQDYFKNNSTHILKPKEVWSATHRGSALVDVRQVRKHLYEAVVEWLDRRFVRHGKKKKEALNVVCCTVLRKILSISLPHWKIYASSDDDDNDPEQGIIEEINDTGEMLDQVECVNPVPFPYVRNNVEICTKRAIELIKSKNHKDVSPLEFWLMIDICYSSCNCLTINENKAVIKFANATFEGNGKDKEESMNIAAYKMLYNHFKITTLHWSKYWETNLEFGDPIPETVYQRIREHIKNNPHSKLKPSKVWNSCVPKQIEQLLIDKRRYEARIIWHDKIFIATNGKLQKVQDAVARLALIHIFEIKHLHWDQWSTIETKIFHKSHLKLCFDENSDKKFLEEVLETTQESNNSKETVDENSEVMTAIASEAHTKQTGGAIPKVLYISLPTEPQKPHIHQTEACIKRAREIIKLGLKCTSPSKFWNMVHNCDSSCNCTIVRNDNHAVIHFDNKIFEGFGANKEESIDIALYKLFYNHFKVTTIDWHHYREKNLEFGDPIPGPVIFQMKCEIDGYLMQRRRLAILKPNDIWKNCVKIKIDKVFLGKKRYEARIKWHDKIFIATEALHNEMSDAVARIALSHIFRINFMYWNVYDKVETAVFEKRNPQMPLQPDYFVNNTPVNPNISYIPSPFPMWKGYGPPMVPPVNFPGPVNISHPNYMAPPVNIMPPQLELFHDFQPPPAVAAVPHPSSFDPFPTETYLTGQPIFYDPLLLRVKNVLKSLTINGLRDSYLQFKHSGVPVLSENEWKLLKRVAENVFPIHAQELNVLMSIFIEDRQIFGGGATEQDAITATIISVFEFIDANKLEIDVETVWIGTHAKGTKPKISRWTDKLKDMQKSLQNRQKCLDDVPCSDIFTSIGIDFTFDYSEKSDQQNAVMQNIKELTSRYALKKLLDIVYDIDQ